MEDQEDPSSSSLSQLPRLDKSSGMVILCGGDNDDEEEGDEQGEAAAALQRWASRLSRQSPVDSVLHICEEEEEEEENGEEERKQRRRALSLPTNQSLVASAIFHPYPSGPGAEGCCKCKKRVQFADAMGMSLASVHHFSDSEDPHVPAAALARLHSFPASKRDLDALLLIGGGRLKQEETPTAPPPPAFLELDFQPLSEEEQQEQLLRERVCLEWVSTEHFDVHGSVLVAPPSCERDPMLEDEKGERVSIRYTFNEWLSYLDVPAELKGPPGMRQFSFNLCVPPCLEPGARLHFAVCYHEASGHEHWDNNGGKNYTLCYRLPEPT
uniref:Protein phosphatase 1 regulatory subunit 3G-like n=1 Tax=Geotrypetes seraphini TaxID=260995 RepID=A0A6P8PUH9_GEOSA|nr:protein phosphatase 1 regulatory subunit 3G-like [Geotrypetes seraphini]